MKPIVLAVSAASLLVLCGMYTSVLAYRDYFTHEQKAQLERIQTVLVEVITLTDQGRGTPDSIRDVVMRRIAELGYAVSADPPFPTMFLSE